MMNQDERYTLRKNLETFSQNDGMFQLLDESAQLQVTDNVLGKLFVFISSKYNEIDFSEIDKSAGNIHKFKYFQVLIENVQLLEQIYDGSEVAGTDKIRAKVQDVKTVIDYLANNSESLSYLWAKDVAYIKLFYNSAITACIFSISTLISLTIRFVTYEESSDMTIMIETIPNIERYTHLRNISEMAKMIRSGEMNKLVTLTENAVKKEPINESAFFLSMVTMETMGKLLLIPAILIILTKLIPIIREIIYSVYYARIRISDALDLQSGLLKTNIESLEERGGNNKKLKRVIVKQKMIAKSLDGLKNKFALKMEVADTSVRKDVEKENKALKIEKGEVKVQEEMLL